MSPFSDLLDELLTMVIILLVTSRDGAADLARLAATCKKFRAFAENSAILKVVNFDGIPFGDFAAHHHVKDLLLLCARAGNVAAESRVAKALLHRDHFFWTIILEHDKPLLAANPQATGILSHRKLIRSFIRHANYKEISTTRPLLCSYALMFLGCQRAHVSGIIVAMTNMTGNVANKRVVSTTPPGDFEQNRALVLTIYDQMFP